MADNPFEIPQQMRDLAEQNIKQAHAAYEQLTDFVTKAMGAWMGAMPASPWSLASRMCKTVLRKSRRRMPTQLSRWSKRSPRHRIFKRF